MGESENEKIEIKEKGLFSEILEIPLKAEILNRALSNFLKDNNVFSDFELHFNPPLLLDEKQFKAFIKILNDLDFVEYINPVFITMIKILNDLDFVEYINPIIITMVRANSDNKKKIEIWFSISKNNNGKITYNIKSINGKTYLNS